jgi:hypothetical protein
MRRLVAVATLVIVAVMACPPAADAYFWKWLDDLSGPQFAGTQVELRVWCATTERKDLIARVRSSLDDRTKLYRAEAFGFTRAPTMREVFLRRGVQAADIAEAYLKLAETAPDPKGGKQYDASEVFYHALNWRDYAIAQYAWAERAGVVGLQADMLRAAEAQMLPASKLLEPRTARLNAFAGATVSVCKAGPLDRHRQIASLNFGYAWDQKDENLADNHRMLTIGASYYLVIAPWLNLGAGAGVARFKSDTAKTFAQAYVQPWIIDVKPFAIGQKKYSPEAWRQIWFVRISSLSFPGGFREGRFGPGSPRLRTELVHSIGIHADLDPVIRKARLRY